MSTAAVQQIVINVNTVTPMFILSFYTKETSGSDNRCLVET